MEGHSYNIEFGGWVHHQTHGFQNRTMVRTDDAATVWSFGVTFTPLSGVFGGACEKYIPLSVMESLEVWLASIGQRSKRVEVSVCTFYN